MTIFAGKRNNAFFGIVASRVSLLIMVSWRVYVTGNNETCLGLYVKCPMFYFDFHDRFSFKSNVSSFAKMDQMGAALINTDVTKVTAAKR